MEYVTNELTTTSTSWTANYHVDGNITTSIPSNTIDYKTDSDGVRYFLFTDNTNSYFAPSYNTENYMLDMDNSSKTAYSQGLSFEAWIKYTGTEGTIGSNKGWLMTSESGWGPCILLNDERFNGRNIATPPGSNTFTSSTPGAITAYTNQMVHVVGWYQSNDHGVYVNGTHYAQNSGSPGLDSFRGSPNFVVGQHRPGSSAHHCPGVRIYAFRVWHQKLEQSDVDILYAAGHQAYVIMPTVYLSNYSNNLVIPAESDPEIEPEPEEEPETNFETYSNPIVMATGHSCIWCMSEEDMKNMLENNTTPGAFASNTNLLLANLSSVINPNLNIVNITIGSTTGTTQALMERCVSETRAILHEMIIGENAYCPYNVTFNSGTFSSPYILCLLYTSPSPRD